MSATIAIATPIGAYHPFLRDCLASLAAQKPAPIISVLDASGDPRTVAVIDEFAGAIAYRRAGPDAGQAAAIVEGWNNAPGDVLGWLNADDALYPGALATVAGYFRDHPDTDVLYGHSVIIDDASDVVGYHWAVEPPSEAILAGCIISQPSCFFRRNAYESVGGLDPALHYTMDWDLWTRLWRAGARFRFTDAVLSRVLWSREAKTGGFGAGRRRELTRIIGAHASPFRRLKSRIGFGMHHVLEYAAPKGLARSLRGAHRSREAIHGLGRTGEIIGDAEVPVAWWGAAPASSLDVDLEVRSGRVIVSAAGKEAAIQESGRASLPAAARAGEMLSVRIRASPDARARLKAIRLH